MGAAAAALLEFLDTSDRFWVLGVLNAIHAVFAVAVYPVELGLLCNSCAMVGPGDLCFG